MPAFKDVTGQRFTRLVVLHRDGEFTGKKTKWVCKCDCGNTKSVFRDSLVSGHTRSCGCLRKELAAAYPRHHVVSVGDRFESVVVIERIGTKIYGNRKDSPNKVWKLLCDCGTYTEATSNQLKSGNKKSCGCRTVEAIRKAKCTPQSSKLSSAYHSTKKRAIARGYTWELDKEYVLHLFSLDCEYCDDPPAEYSNGAIRNGIDRVDNKLGYTKENVVSCCMVCNNMKHTMSYDAWMQHLEKIRKKASKRKKA